MGISRLKWGLALITAGFCISSLRLLPPAANTSPFQREGQLLGQGFVALVCFIGGIAFLIQHYRHHHDYDDEDADRHE